MAAETTTEKNLTGAAKAPLSRSMNLELEHSSTAAAAGSHSMDELAPLTSDMRRQIYELKAAYEEFWQQRKFRKGWARPLFAFDETVEELLARAAESVVRIRSHFDEISSNQSSAGRSLSKSTSSASTHMPRFKEGRAREYLSTLEQDPRAAPQQFVREIVHATLSNEDGYLEEGLTSDKLDRYFDKITRYMQQRDVREAQATAQLEEKLKRRWAKTEKLLESFYALDAESKASKSHYNSLQKIIKRVDDVREELLLMQRRRDSKQARGDDAVAPTVDAEQKQSEAETPSTVEVEQQPSVVEQVNGVSDETRPASEEQPKEEAAVAKSQQVSEQEPALVEEKGEEATQSVPETEISQQVDNVQPEGATEPAETKASAEATAEGSEQDNSAADATTQVKEEADEESEQKRRVEQERQKAMIKIKSVADSVTKLSDQIEGFTNEATGLDMEELQKEPESAEKTLSKLQKQCLFYSENLMKDLLSLDAISTGTLPGSEEASEEVRPLRKQQVKEIQGLLQDVDQVNSKLKAMLKKIQEEKQRKEEQRKKQEMDERAKQPQPPAREETDRAKQAGSPKTSDMWRSMKLKPKFEMAQTHDSIILQAHIPGMNEEDIEIERDDDGQSFTVKGVRVPTPAEEAAMRRQLTSMLARDPWGLYYPQGEKEKDLLMRMGAGRYGSFSETFEVSPEMDLFGISANYAGGVLRVVVPIQQHQRQRKAKPAYRQQAPRYHEPYGAPQRRRHNQPRYESMGGGPQQGFFGDRSFWW